MSKKNASTRQSTTCKLIGAASDLPTSQLPTLRQLLQKCSLTQQSSIKQLSSHQISLSVHKGLMELWNKVHAKLPLYTPNAVRLKVKASYDEYRNVERGRVTVGKKKNFTSRLDKLYNICSCTCNFISHSDTCEQSCTQIHIDCKCGRDKIPVSELAFMKDQQEKEGPTGKYQIGSVDTGHEKKRKRAASKLKSRSNKSFKRAAAANEPIYEAVDSDRLTSTSSEDSAQHRADDAYEPEVFHSDHIDLQNVAREADRYNSSDRQVASILTAGLIDLGIVTKNNTSKVITRQMVRYARMKFRKTVKVLGDDPIKAVYFDEKKDETLTQTQDESGTTRYSKVKIEHCVLTCEPDGTYMTHFALKKGTALVVCDAVYSGLVEMGATDSLEVIGSDTTNTMSGTDGGAHHYIEGKLGRNLFRVLCNLHTNELPFRHLFIHEDGKTSGKECFKGPIGKACKVVKTYEVKQTFTAVKDGDSVPVLPHEVIQQLSWDQKCLYKLLHAVRSGKSNIDIINMKLAGLNHSRWLTLAIRVLYLYMCYHQLTQDETVKLNRLVHFIMTNYGPMWFAIKCKPFITDAPKHVFKQTKLLQLLPSDIINIVKPYVSRSAYFAHPENLLIAMLDDSDETVREKAVNIIKDIRATKQDPSRPVRPFRVPKINYDADYYYTMIDWETETLTEPPLTYKLTDDELNQIISDPLTLPPYKSHTQSTERAIKMVTNASGQVYGMESSRGFIKAQIASRKLYGKADTKTEIIKMID